MKHSQDSQQIQGDYQDFEVPLPDNPDAGTAAASASAYGQPYTAVPSAPASAAQQPASVWSALPQPPQPVRRAAAADASGETTMTLPPLGMGGNGVPGGPGVAGAAAGAVPGGRRAARLAAMNNQPKRSVLWSALGILGEILMTMAAICALYVVWQMWWTGVQAEHAQVEQRQEASWSDPAGGDSSKVAKEQSASNVPVQPQSASEGELVAQVYIPRFGQGWVRNVVEGTNEAELSLHGLGHYETTQMPGAVGNFAVAGHRNGYGRPLGDVDLLQEGDPIIVRTKDYWYVYKYTSYKIVTPEHSEVIAANPDNPGAQPTKRMITLTTCEPKYSTATHRWISYGEFSYWAKVSDGVPKELATDGGAESVAFASTSKGQSIVSKLGTLEPIVLWALVAYLVLYIAALVAWRYPVLREIRDGKRRRPDVSIYGWLLRHQPGPLAIRWLLLVLLLFIASVALIQWACPWAASNIPILQSMSNYAVTD